MTAPAATCAHRWRCAELSTMRLAEPGRYVVTGRCAYCGAERDHTAYTDESNHSQAWKLKDKRRAAGQRGGISAAKKAQGAR